MPDVNLLFWQYVKKLQIRQFRCEIVAKNVIARAQRSIFHVDQGFASKKKSRRGGIFQSLTHEPLG
jgi:hypothetical protein